MKKLLISMLAVATLASCAKEETLSFDKGEAIQFGSFVENSTRAADPSLGTSTNPFTSFNVWGTVDGTGNAVAIYAGDLVSGTIGQNSIWTCATTQYWIKDAVYNFAGVKNGTVKTLENDLPKTITFAYTDGSVDLVYARSKQYTGQASNNPKVAFDFKHLLSKVKFTLVNTTSNADKVGTYTYTLTDVKITNAIIDGTYTVADTVADTINGNNTYNVVGTWANNQAKGAEVGFESITGVTNGTSKDSANEKLIIPMTNATVTYKVNIYYGGEIITTIPGSTTVAEFKPGYAYNLKLSTGLTNEIQFTVEQTPTWTPNGDTTLTL